jgi:hypothetical protein
VGRDVFAAWQAWCGFSRFVFTLGWGGAGEVEAVVRLDTWCFGEVSLV